jgi:hypothetical protein
MKSTVTKLIARTVLVVGLIVFTVLLSSLRPQTTGATFACEGIDLTIDSEAFYNGAPYPLSSWALKNLNPTADHFFDFGDVKPGDSGKTTISLHVAKAPAWACLDFKNLKSNENGVNEPEGIVDPNGGSSGELAGGLEFFAWRDDGDNTFEIGEQALFGTSSQSAVQVLNNTSYTLVDYQSGSAWPIGSTHYVGISWCAGNLTVNLATAVISCDGTVLGNEAQTDSMSVDVALRAYPANQYPQYRCDGKPPEKAPTRTIGFWQTHTTFTSYVFNLPAMQKFIGVNSSPVSGSHKGTITNVQSPSASQLFGAYYASLSKKTNGTNRSSTDKKRMQLLQQLITAKLNCSAVACSPETLNLISLADTAYKNGSGNMLTLASQLDVYNNSGDLLPLPASLGSQGSATPGASQALANKAFWDLP